MSVIQKNNTRNVVRLQNLVIVENPGEIGARLGLRSGDVLRVIDDQEIAITADADKALRAARNRLTLEVQRGTQRLVMRFRL